MGLLAVVAFVGAACGPDAATAQDRAPTPPHADLDDGPYLFHESDGAVVAKWVRGGKVATQRFAAGKSIELPAFAASLGASLPIVPLEPEPAVWEQPEEMLVVSDVEGRYDDFLRFLEANDVVDAKGRWSFGTGHLVCIGDMVDRGTQVTETLWLLHRLLREAKAAGGHVHHVLGNHEAMWMGGDVRYVAPKYRQVADLLGIRCEGLVGADTELGRWLRTRNAVVRIGTYVFVHGGISPAVAAGKTDLDAMNTKIRAVLGVHPQKIADAAARERVWGRSSPLWYRGYFPQFARDFGRTPTTDEFDRMLENLGAKTIVVGHTKVRAVTPMFGGRVIAIDIPWTAPDDVRALLVRKNSVQVADIRGHKIPLRLPPRK